MPAKKTTENDTDVDAEQALKVPVTIEKNKRKKRRLKNGKAAEREIRDEQQKVGLALPKATVRRLIKEVAQELAEAGVNIDDVRFSENSKVALHTAVESYLLDLFNDAIDITVISGQVTLHPKHLKLAHKLQKKHSTYIR